MTRPISLFEKAFSGFKLSPKNNNFSSVFKNLGFSPLRLKPIQMKSNFSSVFKNLGFPPLRLKPIQMKNNNINIPDQIQNLVKNLTSSITRITNGTPKDDYNEIIKGYLPQNAKLITPRNPKLAGTIRFADLDGDSQKELIASYVLNNETTTFILKKQNERWNKLAEIHEPKHNEINYMGFADITGEGRQQLIVGRKGKESADVLHGYNMQNGKINKMFTHNYSRVEVFRATNSKNTSSKKHLALWNRKNTDAYDIQVMHWNGTELEPVKNNTSYYFNKVLPFYGQRVKQMPKNSSHWFHLADTLMKSGMYRDGLSAVEFGLRLNPVSPSKDEFLALKTQLQEKTKK